MLNRVFPNPFRALVHEDPAERLACLCETEDVAWITDHKDLKKDLVWQVGEPLRIPSRVFDVGIVGDNRRLRACHSTALVRPTWAFLVFAGGSIVCL